MTDRLAGKVAAITSGTRGVEDKTALYLASDDGWLVDNHGPETIDGSRTSLFREG